MTRRVLFVHGAAGDARIWQQVIEALPDTIAGHALTLSYFGDAPWPDDGEGFGTELHARDILRTAADIGEPVHLVCWSYGVHPGLAAMLHEPALFASGLFYEAAMPHYIATPEGRRAFAESFAQVFGPVRQAIETIGPKAGVTALIGPHFGNLPEDRRAIYLSNAGMMPLLFSPTLPSRRITPRDLATINAPCCAMLGNRTQDVFALSTRALAQALPHGKLAEVKDADHFLPETDPARFAGLVAEWVESTG